MRRLFESLALFFALIACAAVSYAIGHRNGREAGRAESGGQTLGLLRPAGNGTHG